MIKYFPQQKIGELTLLEFLGKGTWKVSCSCGTIKSLASNHLYRMKSCGCKSKSNRFKKLPPFHIQINIKYNHYKTGALRRKIKFLLRKEEFAKLVTSNCYYCKLPPHKEQKYKGDIQLFNGIDRLDSNKEYTMDNSVSCCSWCNFAKNDRTVNEYLNWLKWVKNNV